MHENVIYLYFSFQENFLITVILTNHYGKSCDKETPRWSSGLIQNSLKQWGDDISTSIQDINLNVIDTCGSTDAAIRALTEGTCHTKSGAQCHGAENGCAANIGKIL